MKMPNDELLDLVDAKDNVIGSILRSESDRLAKTQEGYIRATNAFVQNDMGELLIPRRAANKRIAPNGLDTSMAEHVKAGETYLEATIRGFKEELNIDVSEDDLEYKGKHGPTDDLYYFWTLYVYKSNLMPNYNPEDFIESNWLSVEELVKRLKQGAVAKKSLLPSALDMLN